ncbi:MAG: hypothetical protein WA063_03285 [Minisyncoccia bacterium]
MRKRNKEIKRILGDLKNSLNGSFTRKNIEILALIVGQGKVLWSQVPKGINSAYLSDLVVAAMDNKKELAIELGKKFVGRENNEPTPIEITFSFGRLVVVEVGPCAYFAALFCLNADMDVVRTVMIKTAKELKGALAPCEQNMNMDEKKKEK